MKVMSADQSRTVPLNARLLAMARDLARQAGLLARAHRTRAITDLATKSSPTDVVTAADRAAEELIVAGILARRPDDRVLGEEGGDRGGAGPVRWIIDPIDGTVNYVYGYPHYAVSIAVEVAGEIVVGIVHNPESGEEWTALRGQGAFRGGRRVTGSGQTQLRQALVATGFNYDAQLRSEQGRLVAGLLGNVRDIRRAGACSLDLCYAAEGRVDAYYEQGVNTWDYAAGGLIAEEAGLCVTGLDQQQPDSSMIVVAPPPLHAGLCELLRAVRKGIAPAF